MQLEETFELAFPRERVWAAFKDIPMLVSCLPGASLQGDSVAAPLQLVFAVKLGPVSARFAGEGSIVYHDDWMGSLTGGGSDRATHSRVKGSAAFALESIDSDTRVRLVIDYALSGVLAQVGRPGIVKELAAGLTRQFAANLQSRIAEREGSDSAVEGEAVGGSQAAATTPPLDAGALVGAALVERLKKIVGKQ
ncbi:MAG: SRPBCC domain-containing protein [Burkholderiales bacterium]